VDAKNERLFLNFLALVLTLTIISILMTKIFSDALLNWMFFISIATLLFLSVRITTLTQTIHINEALKAGSPTSTSKTETNPAKETTRP
jgi:hypothetical protein